MSNDWGRWGAEDQRGMLNLIGEEQVRRGMDSVRLGQVVSLAAPIEHNRGHGLVGRVAPLHYMVRTGSDYAGGLTERGGFGFADDVISVPTHGTTHIDALAHIWRDGRMYNDIPATEVTTQGARRLGIENMPPLVTRGVYVDAAASGDREDPVIRVEELQQLLVGADVSLLPGDALLVRTGWLEATRQGRASAAAWPGLDRDCDEFLREADVVLVGCDNPGVECFPSTDPGCQVPLHVALVRGCGVYFSELMDFTRLSATGATTFLFAVAPLPFVGAVGSPVAPIAVV